MRKSNKVQGPHFEVNPILRERWDRMMRRLGRGAVTAIMTTMMEEVLKQLETSVGQQKKDSLEVAESRLSEEDKDMYEFEKQLKEQRDKGRAEISEEAVD